MWAQARAAEGKALPLGLRRRGHSTMEGASLGGASAVLNARYS